jgi:type IV pilus assembly protein PilM
MNNSLPRAQSRGPAMVLFTKKDYYPSLIISEEKIQVTHLDKTGKRASHLAEERLEPQVIVAGEVKEQQKLSQSLNKLFQVAKISERLVVVGIPENKCFTKVLNLPKLKLSELAEAVSWEADSYLPVESDTVYMDWKIINDKDKDTTLILLIAVPKTIIDGYTAALRQAGLIPIAYETTALSLVRLIEKEKIRTLIMEIQLQHAILTLAKANEIEASSIVTFTGTSDEKEPDQLVQTVENMLSYYEAKRKDDGQVKKIYICGEGATESIRNQLVQATKREVNFAPIPIGNLPKGKEQSFAVVAALSKKEIEAPKDEYTINLLPPQIQEESERLTSKKANKLLLTISTAVTTTTTLASLITFLVLGKMHTTLESEKLAFNPLPPETGAAVKETQLLNRAAHTLVKVGKNRGFPQARIANILTSLPEGVKIALITINENQKKIQISGRARTRTELLRFKDNLEGSEAFSEAILPLSSLQQAENVDFVLTAKIN